MHVRDREINPYLNYYSPLCLRIYCVPGDQPVAIGGNTWQYMAMNGSAWQDMAMLGSTWQYKVI